ncbi:MAG: tail fiber domain-containing protein [Bacteroidota bacterium]
MKSLICSIALVLSAFILQAQTYPITQNLGAATTLVKTPNYGGIQGGLIPYTFADTSSANSALTYLKNYGGAVIYTTDCSCMWFRSISNTKWIQILPSGGSGGLQAWLVGGNTTFFGGSTTPEIFGTTLGITKGVDFTTNGVTRVALASTGLGLLSSVSDTTANKVMTFNPSTKSWNYGYWYGAGGGGGGTNWNILGNAGTTAGTNFLGTTDSVSLVFKANNVKSGIIDVIKTSTSFGYSALLSNTLGTGNEAFGTRALTANTIGAGNQAFGTNSLASNISGGGNVAIGSDVLTGNITGQNNTGVGVASLLSNSLGSNNTGIGANTLLGSTGDNNLAIGYGAGSNFTTESKRLFIGSILKSSKLADSTEIIIYGAQDATAGNQRLYLNSQLFNPYIATQHNAADSMVVVLPGTGKFGYRSIPSSSGITGSGTSGQVGVWNGTSSQTGYTGLLFNGTTNTLSVAAPAASTTALPAINLKFNSDANPPMNLMAYDHDNMRINFDAFYDYSAMNYLGSYSSSQFSLLKNNNLFQIQSGAAAAGAAVTWATGFAMTAAGLVGIGTISPTGKLDVVANSIHSIFVDNSTGNVGVGTNAPAVALDVVGGVQFSLNGATDVFNGYDGYNGNNIWSYSTTNLTLQLGDGFNKITLDNGGGNFINYNGASHNFLTGNVGIGAAADATGNLLVADQVGTGTRPVLASSTGVQSAPVSDSSVKQFIKPIGIGLNTVMKLKPVSFYYKDKYKAQYGKGEQIGFIAQDINAVLPNITYYNTAGLTKGKMGYVETDLIPVLTKALQEVYEITQTQKKQIEKLQKEVKKLKRKK